MGQKGFFDFERRLEVISAKGDPPETIKKIVPWEVSQQNQRKSGIVRGSQIVAFCTTVAELLRSFCELNYTDGAAAS
jgi:hypothetical protein